MKKLLLIIVLFINLFAANETLQDNLNKYLTAVPTTQCIENISLGSYVKKSENGNALFTFILDGVDLSTGKLTYNVYKVNEEFNNVQMGINNEVDKISFTNPSCNYSEINEEQFKNVLQENGLSNYSENKANELNNQLLYELQELENKYIGKDAEFKQTGNKKYLTTASYLLACLTFNESIIDIKKSLQLNRIILKPGYTIHPNNQVEKVEVTEVAKGFSSVASSIKKTVKTSYTDVVLDSVTEYLSDNVILYAFDFRARWNEVLLKMKTFLFLTFLPFSVGFLSLSKITKKISKINDFDDVTEKGVMVIVLLFMFYFTNGTANKFENSNGDTENINLSNFQKFSSKFFDKSMDFANQSANIFASSYINFNRKSAGYLSEKEIINITGDTAGVKQQQQYIESFYEACKRDWNIDEVRNRFNITTKKDVISFPNSKQYNDFIKGSIDGASNTNNIEQFLNENITYPVISLTGCYKLERDWIEITKTIEKNKELLSQVMATQENGGDRKQLLKIAKVQYYTVAEQGFIGIPEIAVTNIVTDSLNMFGSDRSTQNMKAFSDRQKEMNNLDDGWTATQTLFESLAFMIVPGANAIKEFGTDNTSFLEKVPFVGKFLSSAVGTGLAISVMKYLVLYFPVVAVSMASLMVIGWYFISVFIYFLVSPFIIVYAMSQQQTDIIKDFLVRGVALAFKPILIILSVVVAVLAVYLFKDLSIILFDSNFALLIDIIKNKTSVVNPLDLFFMFLKGLLILGASVVSTVSAFQLVFNGSEIISGMFGFKQSGIDVKEVVGSAVESKTSKYNTPGA